MLTAEQAKKWSDMNAVEVKKRKDLEILQQVPGLCTHILKRAEIHVAEAARNGNCSTYLPLDDKKQYPNGFPDRHVDVAVAHEVQIQLRNAGYRVIQHNSYGDDGIHISWCETTIDKFWKALKG